MSNKSLENFFSIIEKTAKLINIKILDELINNLYDLREKNGRLFFLGVGGSAANASHAVNDFRKLCGIECYSPTDNVSELTARINDDGWDSAFVKWLEVSKLNHNDAIFILSVGGGNLEKNVSVNLVNAIKYSKSLSAKVLGIVGRDGGYAKKNGDCILLIPNLDERLVTPIAESYQGIIWHSIVSDPKLQINQTKW